MEPINFLPFTIIFFVIFAGVIIKKNSNHAELKHDRTNEIRKQYKKNGAVEIWQENNDKKTFHFLVLLEDGLYGDWIANRNTNGNIFEKSAFIPKDGSLNKIHIWLSGKATQYYGEI